MPSKDPKGSGFLQASHRYVKVTRGEIICSAWCLLLHAVSVKEISFPFKFAWSLEVLLWLWLTNHVTLQRNVALPWKKWQCGDSAYCWLWYPKEKVAETGKEGNVSLRGIPSCLKFHIIKTCQYTENPKERNRNEWMTSVPFLKFKNKEKVLWHLKN